MITLTIGTTPWTRGPPPEYCGPAKATSQSDGRTTEAAATAGRLDRLSALARPPCSGGGPRPQGVVPMDTVIVYDVY